MKKDNVNELMRGQMRGQSIGTISVPQVPQSIDFVIDGNTIISVKKDGIYYKGRLLELDKEIEDAFRDFFTKKGIL